MSKKKNTKVYTSPILDKYFKKGLKQSKIDTLTQMLKEVCDENDRLRRLVHIYSDTFLDEHEVQEDINAYSTYIRIGYTTREFKEAFKDLGFRNSIMSPIRLQYYLDAIANTEKKLTPKNKNKKTKKNAS